MKVSVFWGCRIQTAQYAYEMSVREVLPKLGVELIDLPEATCCGDPVKSVNDFAATYLSARILAMASSARMEEILVPCNRCHFVISEAKAAIANDGKTGDKIRTLLKEEGLKYNPSVRIWHTIDFLYPRLDNVKKAVVKPFRGVKLATHYGCQILRYTDLGRVDDAESPRKLDALVCALGAETVDYSEKLDCCGAHLMLSHVDSALSLAGSKMRAVQDRGIDGLVVSCPDCGLMFDAKQKEAATTAGAKLNLPVVYLTQLLGLALGIEQVKLGLHLNQSPVDQLLLKVSA